MISRCRIPVGPRALLPPLIVVALGCKDPTMVDLKLAPVGAGPVQSHGLSLDERATPQQVVYMMLQAVREDVQAARNRDVEALRSALELQASLAAADWMYRQQQQALERRTMPVEISRDLAVYKLVRFWGPLLAHYVESFDQDPDTATEKMWARFGQGQQTAVVYYDVHSDSGDSQATVQVDLIREQGYWKIKRISFARMSVAEIRARYAPSTRPAAHS